MVTVQDYNEGSDGSPFVTKAQLNIDQKLMDDFRREWAHRVAGIMYPEPRIMFRERFDWINSENLTNR